MSKFKISSILKNYDNLNVYYEDKDSSTMVISNSKNNRLLLMKLEEGYMYSAITDESQKFVVDKLKQKLESKDKLEQVCKDSLTIYSALVELKSDPKALMTVKDYDKELVAITESKSVKSYTESEIVTQMKSIRKSVNELLRNRKVGLKWSLVENYLDCINDIISTDLIESDNSTFNYHIIKAILECKKLLEDDDKYASHMVNLAKEFEVEESVEDEYRELGLIFDDDDDVFKYHGHSRGPIDPNSTLISGEHGDWEDSVTAELDGSVVKVSSDGESSDASGESSGEGGGE